MKQETKIERRYTVGADHDDVVWALRFIGIMVAVIVGGVSLLSWIST